MKKYLVITTYRTKDGKYCTEKIEHETFAEAANEFNDNCAYIIGSTIWLDTESNVIIRQFIRKYDGLVILK